MKVAVAGLGAMGMGIAKSSLRAGLDTVGYDVSEEKRLTFSKAGGVVAATSAKAAVDADCLAIVVVIRSRQKQCCSVKTTLLQYYPRVLLFLVSRQSRQIMPVTFLPD